jgi:hypothetical protein
MGSLRTVGLGLNFEADKFNVGIGSGFTSNIRLSVYNNNPQSWRTAIFKNTFNSDYLSIGTFNNNTHLSVIANDNQSFKDLYINNLGNSLSSNIGNVIINGKTTIGNFSNNTIFNHSLDVVSQTSNIALFRNANYQLSFSCNATNITLNTNNNRIGIIPDTYLSSNLYVSGFIIGSNYLSNITNPSLYKMPANWINIKPASGIIANANNELELNIDTNGLAINNGKLTLTGTVSSSVISGVNFWGSNSSSEIYFLNGNSFVGIGNNTPKSLLWIGQNGNLLRLTSPSSLNNSYYTQISTNDDNINNTNIRLITPSSLNTISGADVSLSAGSIYYTIAGDNPSHNFIYEKDGNKTNLMNIYKSGTVALNSSGKLILGNSNAEAANYSLYVNNNAKFNNKVVIGTTINSFDGFPIITEYPLNVYGNIGITGNIFTTSDEKVKTNIKTIENSLDKICGCRGVSFNYLNDSNKNQFGVIAQEIEKIIPDVVESNQYGLKNVNYLSIIGFLIEAVKELNHKINSNRI